MARVFVELLNELRSLRQKVEELEQNKIKENEKPIEIEFRLLRDGARLPYRYLESLAYDLYLVEDVTIYPWNRGRFRKKIQTGIAVNLPKNFGAKTYARSSINDKTGIRVNTGLIDNDYTGEIALLVDNISWFKTYTFKKGDRIGQLEVYKTTETKAVLATEAKKTERGAGGFGSSGK